MNASNWRRALSRAARPVGLGIVVLTGGLMAGALTGCGGSGNNTNVPVPAGGVAIGNIVCASSMEPSTNAIAHGQAVQVRYVLSDVNTQLVGANLPVAFDVVGGALLDPPTSTDAAGVVVVTFVANDPGFVGAGRVRLIGPTDSRLICDVAFTVYQVACILRAEVLDGSDAVVTASDACGTTEFSVERHVTRKIRYRVTRINPFTLVEEPVAGAMLRLSATGLSFTSMDIGPTNGAGMVTQVITPFPTGTGVATVMAEVIRPDVDGPAGGPDGLPDTLPCNTCQIGFNIINPICDADGVSIMPVYRDAFGTPKASPLRPGESADLTYMAVVDGVPQVGRAILVDAEDGFIDGSANPVIRMTNGAGMFTVTYTARNGFFGLDTVTFQDNVGTLQCTRTASVSVVTCGLDVMFGAPVTSGADVPVTIHLLAVDPATAIGQTVSLDVVGGFFTLQPPMYVLVSDGGIPAVMTTLHVTPGFSGPASLSMSFVSGYACDSVVEPFTVLP